METNKIKERVVKLFDSSDRKSKDLAIEKLCRYYNDDSYFTRIGKQKELNFFNGRVSALRDVINIIEK